MNRKQCEKKGHGLLKNIAKEDCSAMCCRCGAIVTSEDPSQIKRLGALRNRVVRISTAISEAGLSAWELNEELKESSEELTGIDKEAYEALWNFTLKAMDAGGAKASLGDPIVDEDDPTIFRQMCRTTAIIDNAIVKNGGMV